MFALLAERRSLDKLHIHNDRGTQKRHKKKLKKKRSGVGWGEHLLVLMYPDRMVRSVADLIRLL